MQILFFGLVRQEWCSQYMIFKLNSWLLIPIIGLLRTSVHTSITPSGDPLSTANGYRVFQQDGSGKCTLVIIGHGVDKKVVKSSCKTKTPSVINIHKSLLVGNYFTDTPGVLIHFVDGNCERVYGDRTTRLNDEECEEVKRKVVMLRQELKVGLNRHEDRTPQLFSRPRQQKVMSFSSASNSNIVVL